jgi:hypothetical protein
MGGLVLAMIVGVLVPPLVVSVLASREPLPRDCGTGQVSPTRLDGAILYTTGSDLWYSEGHPGQPRKLIDFNPRPARRPAGGSPSPSAATPSPAPSPSGSAGPTSAGPRVIAADIASDRRLVAVLVLDPLDRPGFISMRMMSPLDPPGKPPVEAWWAAPDRQRTDPQTIHVMDNNKVLFVAGVPSTNLPAPYPNVSVSPSPTAGGSPSPSPSAAARSTSGGTVAVVVDPALGHTVDQAPLDYFLSVAHSRWADTKTYRVPAGRPALQDRVDGPQARVAGLLDRQVVTPLATRHLNQVALGSAGSDHTSVVCTAPPGTVPLSLSPDETGLALYDGQATTFLDLAGTHATTPFIDGRLLAWRA